MNGMPNRVKFAVPCFVSPRPLIAAAGLRLPAPKRSLHVASSLTFLAVRSPAPTVGAGARGPALARAPPSRCGAARRSARARPRRHRPQRHCSGAAGSPRLHESEIANRSRYLSESILGCVFPKIILAQDYFCSIIFSSVFSKTDKFFRQDEELCFGVLRRMLAGRSSLPSGSAFGLRR